MLLQIALDCPMTVSMHTSKILDRSTKEIRTKSQQTSAIDVGLRIGYL